MLIDPSGVISSWNEGGKRLTGYEDDEIVGKHFSILLTREDREAGLALHEMQEAERHGRAEKEGWRVRKDGSRFWGNEILTALRDEQRQLVGFTKIIRDLSVSKRMEDELRQGEERYRGIIESVREYAIFRLSCGNVVTSWNLGVERVLGYSQDEWLGQSGTIIFTAEDRAAGECEKEQRRAIEDGQPDGEVTGFTKVVRDNTDRKNAQDALEASRAELEERVSERTAELSQTVALLEQEIARGQELESALLRAIDDERQRFGQELHDGICQHLAGTRLVLGALEKRVTSGKMIRPEELRDTGELIESTLVQTRGLARGLHPVTLTRSGLVTALRELAALTSLSVPCEFVAPECLEVEPDFALHLYRIAQEAVTNAVKHSAAEQITIGLQADHCDLTLTVVDRGAGFDTADVRDGMGLHNMKHRARAIGAMMSIDSRVGEGTSVICRLSREAAGA